MRPVYACSLHLKLGKLTEDNNPWFKVRDWVKGSYQRKHPSAILSAIDWQSKQAQDCKPIDGHRIQTSAYNLAASSEPSIHELVWAFLSDDDQTIHWNTRVNVMTRSEDAIFEIVLSLSSSEFVLSPARFQLGSPRIVRELVKTGGAFVGDFKMVAKPINFAPVEIDEFCDFMLSDKRRFPLVLVSTDLKTDGPLIDVPALAENLSGIAAVATPKSKWSTFAITDEFGKELSCFDGAIRIYWPGFTRDQDPYRHPLYLPRNIASFRNEKAFRNHIVRAIAAVSAFRYVEHKEIRHIKAESEKELRELVRKDGMVKKDYDQLFDEYAKLDDDYQKTQIRLEKLEDENNTLRQNVVALSSVREHVLDVADLVEGVEQEPELKTVREAVETATRKCKHLVFLPDAFESADESPYKNPRRALTCLSAIDDVAAEWLNGERKSWYTSFAEKGFEYKDKVSMTSLGKWGEEYFHFWKNKKILFKRHITIGAKQPDRCLSVHFEKDDDDKKIIIAYVGRHKTNTKS